MGVIVDKGVAKDLSTTTLKDDAYAFIFDQQGLMAGIVRRFEDFPHRSLNACSGRSMVRG